MLAALNHPNIAAIYGLEEVEGTRCLILELVEGPTLADRIALGDIPRDEALAIARQIAEALEAAHDQGIVHRDLKPANIKVRPDGTVKVLDFGLAKALDPAPAAGSVATMSPTLSLHATQAGIILGTAAYMSPEQASGKPVDKRADIWSFGVVLWELLCGKRLFDGETVSHTLAAVLTQDPDWALLPSSTPASVRRLIRRCVVRDLKRRLPDIGSARLELEEAIGGVTGGDTQVPSQTMGVRRWLAWTVVGALTVALVIALVALWRATRPADATGRSALVPLDVDLGSDVLLAPNTGPAVVLSPDGTRLVFVSQASDGVRLFTRRLEEPTVVQLSGTEGAYDPFFSPDGQWVGFFAGGKLKKTRIDGGEPVPLIDAPAGRGASWSEDGSIIAVLDTQVGLSQVPSEGGKAVPLTELGPGEVTHRWPHVLPGGAAVLFTAGATYGAFDRADIAVVSLKDRRTKVVLQDAGMNPRYLPTGHLAYVTRGTLFAVPFELDRLEARGSAVPLQEVSSDPLFGSAHIDVSRSGTIVYRSGRTEGLNTVQWLDGVGNMEPVITEPGGYLFPRLSRDGSRLLVRLNDETGTDLWVYDLRRGGNIQRLTGGANLNSSPVWSPDGRFVVLQSLRGMFWTRADGAGESQPFAESKTAMFPNSFNRDGTLLAFSELTAGGAEVRTMSVEGGPDRPRAGKPQLFVRTSTANAFPAFSPDGRWLAYADTGGGRFEVYVRAFPDNGTRNQISTAGGMMPIWSLAANELFYRTEDQRIMVATYTVKGESFVAEQPRVWSGKPLANTGTAPNFDLAPDGKRFIVLMSAERPEPRETQGHVKIAVNFFDEVRRRTGVTR